MKNIIFITSNTLFCSVVYIVLQFSIQFCFSLFGHVKWCYSILFDFILLFCYIMFIGGISFYILLVVFNSILQLCIGLFSFGLILCLFMLFQFFQFYSIFTHALFSFLVYFFHPILVYSYVLGYSILYCSYASTYSLLINSILFYLIIFWSLLFYVFFSYAVLVYSVLLFS